MARIWTVCVAVALLGASCGEAPSELAAAPQPDPQLYAPMCRTALVAAKEFSRRLRTSTVADALPVIVSAGPPVRIRCAVRTRSGVAGEVTADVRCLRQFDRACVLPVTATLDGRIVQGPGRVGPDHWP